MSNPFNDVQKMYDEIDDVLSKYGLQIATLTGQFKHPIEITITIEESDTGDTTLQYIKLG